MDLVAFAQANSRADRARADEWDRIAAEATAERRDWQSQTGSPLGNRRHVAAVRRRVAAGLEGAAIRGRTYLLSATALDDELAALAERKPVKTPEPETVGARLRAKLGLVAGCGR
jgi:hypothetical protein